MMIIRRKRKETDMSNTGLSLFEGDTFLLYFHISKLYIRAPVKIAIAIRKKKKKRMCAIPSFPFLKATLSFFYTVIFSNSTTVLCFESADSRSGC